MCPCPSSSPLQRPLLWHFPGSGDQEWFPQCPSPSLLGWGLQWSCWAQVLPWGRGLALPTVRMVAIPTENPWVPMVLSESGPGDLDFTLV